jgi:hypothetical protein
MLDISYVLRRSRACRVMKDVLPICFSSVLLLCVCLAQETTGGLQGTVKDPSGAVVAKALVELKGASLEPGGFLHAVSVGLSAEHQGRA